MVKISVFLVRVLVGFEVVFERCFYRGFRVDFMGIKWVHLVIFCTVFGVSFGRISGGFEISAG